MDTYKRNAMIELDQDKLRSEFMALLIAKPLTKREYFTQIGISQKTFDAFLSKKKPLSTLPLLKINKFLEDRREKGNKL